MSPYNPKSAQNLVTMDTLPEGVKTGVVRIRANTEALEWFSSLSASERGQLVEDLYSRIPKESPVTPDKSKSSRAKKTKTSSEKNSGVTTDKTTPKRSRAKKVVS